MWTTLLLAVTLAVLTIGTARAQQPLQFDFEWTSVTNLGLWPKNRTGAFSPTPDRLLNGRGTLTLVASQVPGAAFAFHFDGPTGSGSGLVLADRRTIDPNFAFPTSAVTEPSAARLRRSHAVFRLQGPAARPTGVEIRFVEIYVCRGVPEVCGGIRHLERRFTGTGRLAP